MGLFDGFKEKARRKAGQNIYNEAQRYIKILANSDLEAHALAFERFTTVINDAADIEVSNDEIVATIIDAANASSLTEVGKRALATLILVLRGYKPPQNEDERWSVLQNSVVAECFGINDSERFDEAQAGNILVDYGKLLESTAHTMPTAIFDVHLLPHTKSTIRQAILFTLESVPRNSKEDQFLGVCLTCLAQFQKGVGSTPIDAPGDVWDKWNTNIVNPEKIALYKKHRQIHQP